METVQPSPRGRLLIFIVAYNAERTIESVLKRIPHSLSERYDVEVLIIDDSSQDNTFTRSQLAKRSGAIPFRLTVLFNPVNQGYGGNQKIGFHYAIKNGFDWVALVHGDGQYAPECLPELTRVFTEQQADAVFGSRMMEGTAALKGGMPLYKYVGNKILTRFQNLLLGSSLSEFHSGYRLYSIQALKKVPFDLNSNDFHFDTEIIIQFITAQLQIKERPIPTFYGDEICHVNGLKYAWDVCWTTLQSKVQKYHIFYDRKFDCLPAEAEEKGAGFDQLSIESVFAGSLKKKSNILIMGEMSSQMISQLEAAGHTITFCEEGLLHSPIESCADVDYIVILDDRDLAQRPTLLINRLRDICRYAPNVRLVLAVGNIAFLVTRLLLLMGRFSYTKKGIISHDHFRFFTLRSLRKMLSQNGFNVEKTTGVPLKYGTIFKSRAVASFFLRAHYLLCRLRPSLFAYQLIVIATAKPTLDYLLTHAAEVAAQKQQNLEDSL